MKKAEIQQEIILITSSHFAGKNFQNKDNLENKDIEKNLEEACWDGLINNLLPQILKLNHRSEINLWNIHVADHFLDLQFSKKPVKIEEKSCLNPHIFLQFQNGN